MSKDTLNRLCSSGILSHIDIHFALFVCSLSGADMPELSLAAALVSSRTRQGDICLDLSAIAGTQMVDEADGETPVICPDLSLWSEKLMGSDVVGSPGDYKPLILDNKNRLYLFRYWDYQEKLADLIRKRVSDNKGTIDSAMLKDGLERLVPGEGNGDINWQKVAAFTAVTKNLCIITGGPGTGKTATIAAILALLLEQDKSHRMRIALVSPTGKAAARLQESIEITKKHLKCSESIKRAIPTETSTIHRLLGTIPHSPYFRYNSNNKLAIDVVVIDEASMVDLALMSKLVQALPMESRLILLGDKDQLASVEAGAVLGDICDTGINHGFSQRFCRDIKKVAGYEIDGDGRERNRSNLQDCIIQLKKNYRFGSHSGIGLMSRAVNEGDENRAVDLLQNDSFLDVTWKRPPSPDEISRVFRDTVIKTYGACLKEDDVHAMFRLFNEFRILCAVRDGPQGVDVLNAVTENILREERFIEGDRRWYRGRPILIARNDYRLGLFNGDVGIVLPDPDADKDLRVFFPAPDGSIRKFHPMRLPEHETVYAMTVHKSQGSEFNRVHLLLPDRYSPVLTRELLYTGITRAQKNVTVFSSEKIFRTSVTRRIERTSGLRDALWAE
ncbi:MAG: exodeoxyribonuclease V subunit alpha [Deltaproteobacteria bacterium]|nr:exodeoxyribonuclease V subunit alpha [Deltaproteobacteria bacterium]